MLNHTFIHLPGIGPHRERKLWDQGILDWNCFLDAASNGILTKKMCESAVPLVRQSLEAIAAARRSEAGRGRSGHARPCGTTGFP